MEIHFYFSGSARGRGPFQEAYVFIVGGGNYIEYQNIQDYCLRQQSGGGGVGGGAGMNHAKRVTYGTTELMDATEFLAQVTVSCDCHVTMHHCLSQLSLLGKSGD